MLRLKPDLGLRCDGEHLSSRLSWGDLAYTHGWPNGCADATFKVTRKLRERPRMLTGGAIMDITWGGWPIWVGTIEEPEWNGREAAIKANGMFKLGENFKAFTTGGATTDVCTTAIAAAQPRGLPWLLGSGIPATALNTGDTDEPNSILELMEAAGEKAGQRWKVDGRRYVSMSGDPTLPYYHVPEGIADLGVTLDGFASRVVLNYWHTSGIYKRTWWPGVTIHDGTAQTDEEKKWTVVEWAKDAVPLGPMSDATASALAQKIYELGKNRPGWTNGLTLAYGQILNTGFKAVHPASVEAGRMVRLHGVFNDLTGAPYTDFVIGDTSYRVGDKSVGVNPVGLTVNSPEAAWTKLFEAGDD